MSEFKGTKGYWEQNRYCVFAGENEEIGKNVICRLHHGLNNYMGNEQPYNAQLIAHAPQMLSKLNQCISAIESCGFKEDRRGKVYNPEIGQSFIDSIKQLIQQATTIK